ncbi:hypothetical protein HKX48_008708 [Thoreauomyces humboldtii]|nr:hypothetical protein HKX48_008708 [Thoreauomyces humboldtii]
MTASTSVATVTRIAAAAPRFALRARRAPSPALLFRTPITCAKNSPPSSATLRRHANAFHTGTTATCSSANTTTTVAPSDSVPSSHVTITKKPNGYALVSLSREPVNSMDLSFWTQLLSTLDACEQDPTIRGIVFHSTLARPVFTAGNDIKELYAGTTTKDRHRVFWKTSNVFLARLLESPLATVAAVKGACPAGGACLAMACDKRVVTGNAYIGLNEVALGIPVPPMWVRLMERIVGTRRASDLLLNARLVKADEARTLGLVDHVVTDEEELMAKAEEVVLGMVGMPEFARTETKKFLNQDLAREWGSDAWLEEEHETAWKMLDGEETRAFMKATLDRLSRGKAKK